MSMINTQDILNKIEDKLQYMMNNIGDRIPHVSKNGVYDSRTVDWWTTGFYPGMLWILYDLTKNEEYKRAAWRWDDLLADALNKGGDIHHDVGFQFLPTACIKYELTGDGQAKHWGLEAANFLAGRFNIAGNYIRSWNNDLFGWSIIDSSLNISLLFWASRVSGDPRFKHIGLKHAETIVNQFIRDDGSVCHIKTFDPETGESTGSLGGQGFGVGSAWSRGQAWAILGMANTYRNTGDMKYLNAARRVANFFVSSLPDDCVPYWDFYLPTFDNQPRDSSAAAIAASGLLEISKYLPQEQGEYYKNWAIKILESLIDNYSTLNDVCYEGILLGGTGNKPQNIDVNVSLIYGDYFFVEALAKLSDWRNSIF